MRRCRPCAWEQQPNQPAGTKKIILAVTGDLRKMQLKQEEETDAGTEVWLCRGKKKRKEKDDLERKVWKVLSLLHHILVVYGITSTALQVIQGKAGKLGHKDMAELLLCCSDWSRNIY